MKPRYSRQKELAEEPGWRLRKIRLLKRTEAPRQAESGGVMKNHEDCRFDALIVCALNRFFHFSEQQ